MVARSHVAGAGSRGWFFLSVFGRCGTGAEAEAVIPGLKDVAVVRQPIQQYGHHLGITEHTSLLAEAEIGGNDDAGLLAKLGGQMEQQRAA